MSRAQSSGGATPDASAAPASGIAALCQLLDTLTQPALLLDAATGALLHLNPGALALTGLPAADLLSRGPAWDPCGVAAETVCCLPAAGGATVPVFATLSTVTSDDRLLSIALLQEAQPPGKRAHSEPRPLPARVVARQPAPRTERMHAVTEALARALSLEDVAAVLVEQGTAACEAVVGGLWVLGADGAQLTLIRAAGFPPEAEAALRVIAVEAYRPCTEAARSGEPVWFETPEEAARRFPGMSEGPVPLDLAAGAALPLRVDGQVVAVLSLGYDQPRAFSGDERAELLALLRQGSLALERAQLLEAERAARTRAAAIVESTTDAIIAVGRDWRVSYANARAAALLGAPAEELAGRRPWRLYTGQDTAGLQHHIVAAMDAGRPAAFETYVEALGVWFDVHVQPAADGIYVSFRDITARKQAEAKLRMQAAVLMAQGEASLDGILIIDQERRIFSRNQRWFALWNLAESLRATESAPQLVEAALRVVADADAFLAWVVRLEADPELTQRAEIPLRDGRILESYSAPVRGPEGEKLGRVIYVRDVTERQRAEAALRASEARYRAQFTGFPFPAFAWQHQDGDFVLVDFNHAGDLVTHGRVRDLVGSRATTLYEDLPEIVEDLRRCVAGGVSVERALWYRYRSTDETRYLHLTYTPVPGDLVIIYADDITERRQAELALRTSEERFRSLVQNVTDVIVILEETGQFRYQSPAMERMLGWPPHEVAGEDPALLLHPDDLPAAEAALQRVRAQPETPAAAEFRIRHKDGSWRVIEAMFTNMLGNPAVRGLVVHGRDITERRAAEQRLRRGDSIHHAAGVAAARFLSATDWEQHIPEVLAQLGAAAEASRVYLFERYLGEGGRACFRQRYEWVAEGISPEIDNPLLQAYAFSDYGDDRSEGLLAAGEAVHFRVPELAEAQRRLLEAQNVRSVILVPVFAGQQFWGFLGFDECHTERAWSTTEEDALHMAARALGATVLRRREQQALAASEERFRLLAENARDTIFRLQLAPLLRLEYIGPSVAQLCGYTPEELYADATLAVRAIHPEDRQIFRGLTTEPGRFDGPVELRFIHRSGATVWLEMRIVPVTGADGQVVAVEGVARDITERRRSEQSLRESETRFRSLIQHISDVITVLDADGLVRYHSPSVQRVLGYDPEALTGRRVLEIVHPEDQPLLRQFFAGALRGEADGGSVELRVRHRDGSWRSLEAYAVALLDDPGVRGIVFTSRDVTERKQFEEQLAHLAFHDPLTGLPNRALFLNRLEHALARAERREGAVAVLFLDLDRFKVVNDSLGHAAGDELLTAVAARLRGCLRPSDTLARFGGDEFTVLLEHINRPADAASVAERIIDVLSAPVSLSGHEVVVTASVGIVLNTDSHAQPSDLLRDADLALYQAKGAGRARYVLFDSAAHARAVDRLTMEADLRRALEREELVIHYQPEVELSTGRIVGMEALLRWQHPTRGLVPPGEFIPLAEETGLIIPISEWVLHTACHQARYWQESQRRGSPPLLLSVNLSPQHFRHPDLLPSISRALAASKLEPSCLRLEITEGAVVDGAESTVATMLALKGLGVRLAIDDFGTGYSSLSYLTRFAVDTLKVDRSFVMGVAHDQRTFSVVKAVAAIAHALGMDVTAEGIETAEQLARVRGVKCDWGQGFYFFRPMPADRLTAILRGGM